MSDIDKLIEKHYEDGFSFDSLLSMINEQMDALEPYLELIKEEKGSDKFSGAKFYSTALKSFKAPTEQAGKLGTDERVRFQKYISRNIKGNTLGEKVDSINSIAAGTMSTDPKISEIMASLGALKMLQETLDDFNESTAGFLFEAFLSGLLQGEQVTDRVGGTLPIEDCMFFVDPKTGDPGQPVSLKLLSTRTIIEGSIVNLLGFFRRPEIAAVANEKGIEYIVATKTKGNRLDIYSFTIKPENFFMWLDEKHFNFQAPEFLEAVEDITTQDASLNEVNDPDSIKRAAKIWMNNVRTYRYPMMGLSPDQELKMDWRKITDWRNIIPMPSTAAKAREQVAANMLSDKAKSSFRAFTQKKFGASGIENLVISDELEAQFLQQDNPEGRAAAAIELVKLARARRAAYLDTIEGWGLDQPESPAHIQRYFAMLNPKTGQMKAVDAQQKLQALVKNGDAESIIRWATALEYARAAKGDTQFHIKPVTVRGRSTVYGTINVDRKRIYRVIQKYSDVLKAQVAPIYENLEKLSQYINGYFLQNRTGDAFKASDTAKELSRHTSELTKQSK